MNVMDPYIPLYASQEMNERRQRHEGERKYKTHSHHMLQTSSLQGTEFIANLSKALSEYQEPRPLQTVRLLSLLWDIDDNKQRRGLETASLVEVFQQYGYQCYSDKFEAKPRHDYRPRVTRALMEAIRNMTFHLEEDDIFVLYYAGDSDVDDYGGERFMSGQVVDEWDERVTSRIDFSAFLKVVLAGLRCANLILLDCAYGSSEMERENKAILAASGLTKAER